MKKQTAVEWLVEQLEYRLESLPEHNLFDQAIEMEKEQIIDAYDKGEFNQGCNEDAEEYYNETYERKTTESK